MPAQAGKEKAEVEELLSREAVVPQGVVYKKAATEVNRKALRKLRGVFLAADNKDASEELFSTRLICGPGLWRQIKYEPEMKKIKEGVTEINVPTGKGVQVLEGKLFQGADEIKAFWAVFRQKCRFDAETTIRRPTPRELQLYWAMIPYDITEPIFVVRSKRATILVHFVAKDERVFWIDDYKDLALTPDRSAAGAPPVFLFSYFRGNGEDGLHLASSRDGYRWTALNHGRPLLTPQAGHKLMRDPCLLQEPDGTFHMVWTTGWGDRVIGYASSRDLVQWSPQQAIPVMMHEPTARNAWAPELFYDEDRKQFLSFWATTIPGRFPETDHSGDDGWNHRIYATTTVTSRPSRRPGSSSTAASTSSTPPSSRPEGSTT